MTPVALAEAVGYAHRRRVDLSILARNLIQSARHIVSCGEYAFQLKIYIYSIAHAEGVYHTTHGGKATRRVVIHIHDTHACARKQLGIVYAVLAVAANPVREVQHRIGVRQHPGALQTVVVRHVELTHGKLRTRTHNGVEPLCCAQLNLPAHVARGFLLAEEFVPRRGVDAAGDGYLPV